MKFKNVLVCTMAILPMFCAIESQAGDWVEEVDNKLKAEKQNSQAYKNTQKLNEKQKLFLKNVIRDSFSIEKQLALCYFENGISSLAESCKTGAEGFGWAFHNNKTDYILEKRVQSYNHTEKEVKEKGKVLISEIVYVAEPAIFGEGVTFVQECTISADEQVLCYPSKKSTCIQHDLCKNGVYDVLDHPYQMEKISIQFQ